MFTFDWLMFGMPIPTPIIDCDLSIPLAPDEVDTIDSMDSDADIHSGGLESDQTWGNPPNFHLALRRLRRSFGKEVFKTKKDKKLPPKRRAKIWRLKYHGAGCHKVMLPETEKGLRKEIAYYLAKNKVAPAARRLHNPIDKFERPLPTPGKAGRLWL